MTRDDKPWAPSAVNSNPAIDGVRALLLVCGDNERLLHDLRAMGHPARQLVSLRDLRQSERIDAVLIDLACLGAWELIAACSEAARHIPILAIVGVGATSTTLVRAIDAGATGCLVIPSDIRTLDTWLRWAARRARRYQRKAGDYQAYPEAPAEPLAIDTAKRLVSVHGREAPMTPGVFELLVALQRYRNRVVGREWLLRTLCNVTDMRRTRALDVRVTALRKALALHAIEGIPRVETVRGVGYQLVM